jgi:hypothetical protein
MSFRRKHRWLRRLALGFALATAVAAGNASFAFAKVDEGAGDARYVSTPGWSGLVDNESGIPLSAGIPEGDEPFIAGAPQMPALLAAKDRIEAMAAAEAGTVDGSEALLAKDRIEATVVQPEPEVAYLSQRQLEELASRPSPRPDDVADRFAHSDVAPQPRLSTVDEWTFERGDAVMLLIGGTILVLGLGLALGYVSRPRIVGL